MPEGGDPLVVGIVANEPSGDLLGASLAQAIRARVPNVRFVGIAGPRMLEAGCSTLFDQERLAVMGLTEVLAHLRELLAIRAALERYFLANPPDVFIGVDAPDFNLGLERRLRDKGIRTVHFVSPTVWAWRPGRVRGIRRAVDLMLSIFPFEETFLREHGVPATYVGHPLAEAIPLEVDRLAARRALGLPEQGCLVAVLPGSRMGEVERLAEPFIETAKCCFEARPDLVFAAPMVSGRLRALFEAKLRHCAPGLPLSVVDGHSRNVLAAADCVLTASGTATLEALLLKRPMVVGYRVHPISYHLVKTLGLVKVPHVAMANLLAGRELAPELLQDRCRPELLAPALLGLLDDGDRRRFIAFEYARIHRELRRNAADSAAVAVLDLIGHPASGAPSPC
ncbi:lipid-A-disaccharide synthase [Thiorhodococcus minor]|uniref:Lipid-A-disaccharide synthase n=1 Tax=Thiorhodococcus minor TaxID=57489 RepID=A0A6M0JVC3_9GAMM|nr:lipid-A-disaccharide synthase [Thiorhodococcus minor]NEV61478.1 lipid-A-disaccharide synthase [Thiorhodococcus minor]